MKSLIAIVFIGMMIFSIRNFKTNNVVLEEIVLKMKNLDYEAELESVDLMNSNNFYLQNNSYGITKNNNSVILEAIKMNIPNYKYEEELESVVFN